MEGKVSAAVSRTRTEVESSGASSTQDQRVHRYSKKDMLKICKVCVERGLERPAYLSTQFMNDVGLWSPEAWLTSIWGKENGGNPRRKQLERVKNEQGDDIVLSPQRRSFGAGCRRPASPRMNNFGAGEHGLEAEEGGGYQKQPPGRSAQGNAAGGEMRGTHWRNSDRMIVNSNMRNSAEQRQAQDRGGGQQSSWRDKTYVIERHPRDNPRDAGNWRSRGNSGSGGYSGFQQGYRRYNEKREGFRAQEETPEWLSGGPKSAFDTIELKGFDDDWDRKEGNRYEEIIASHRKQKQKRLCSKSPQLTDKPDATSSPLTRFDVSWKGVQPLQLPPRPPGFKFFKSVLHRSVELEEEKGKVEKEAKPESMDKLMNLWGISAGGGSTGLEEYLSYSEPSAVEGGSTSGGGSRFSRFFNATEVPADTNNNEKGKQESETDKQGAKIIEKLLSFQQEASAAATPEMPQTAKSLAEIEQGMREENTPSTSGQGRALRGQGHQQCALEGDPQVLQELLSMGSGEKVLPTNAVTEQQILMGMSGGQPRTGAQAPHGYGKSGASGASGEQTQKGNPLGDPKQQIRLMETLKSLQLQQGTSNGVTLEQSARTPSPQSFMQGSGTGQQGMNPGMMGQFGAVNGGRLPGVTGRGPSPQFGGPRMPPMPTPEVMAFQQMYMQWLAQQSQQMPGVPVPYGQSREQDSRHSPTRGGGGGGTTAFMPTSVMKQMSKSQNKTDVDKGQDAEPGRDLSVAGHSRNRQEGGGGQMSAQQMQAAQPDLMRAYQQQYLAMAAQMGGGQMRGQFPMGFPGAGLPPMMRGPGGHPDPLMMQHMIRAQYGMQAAALALQQQQQMRQYLLQQQVAGASQQRSGRGPSPREGHQQTETGDAVSMLLGGGTGAGLGGHGFPADAKPISVSELERKERAKATSMHP